MMMMPSKATSLFLTWLLATVAIISILMIVSRLPNGAYIGVFIACSFYAVALSTPLGKRFTDRQTWSTVVIGVVIVVGWIAIADVDAATLTAKMFLAGGGPIIARSLILDFIQGEADVKRMIGD